MYSGFWRRFAAVFIDGIIFWALFTALFAVLSFVMIGAAAGGAPGAAVGVVALIYLLGLVGHWLYFAIMESSSMQGTVGKRALGVKVVNAQGERIGFGRATGRYFGKFLSSLILSIGYIMAAFTEKKQALHDMLASTFVVYRDVTPEDIDRGYYDAPPRGAGAVIAIVVIVVLFIPFVGILAAIAIPAYQDYTIRSQVTEGLNLATQVKSQVVQWDSGSRRWPVSAAEINLAPPDSARYVEEIRVSNGTIMIVYGKNANPHLKEQTLALQPTYARNGTVFWRCGHAAIDQSTHSVAREGQAASEDSAEGTTVPDKYLPTSCRAGA